MKRKLTLSAALAFASATGASFAQDAPPPPTRALPEKAAPFDVNGDGRLSREEYKALVEASRQETPKSRWDADNDGKLSEAEINDARAEMRLKLEARFLKRFEEADLSGVDEEGNETDPDGQLSLAEFTATLPGDVSPERALAAFTRLDADADEFISQTEFLKFNGLPPRPNGPKPPKPRPETPKPKPPVRPPLPDFLLSINENGDGVLSRDEIQKGIKDGTWPVRPPKAACSSDRS